MSKDLNLCQFIGRLGQDPEVRFNNNGGAIANLSLATSDDYKDKNSGENVSNTNWIKVVAFGRLAEIIQQYVAKGSQIYISGKMVTRKWQDQQGQDRYTTEIVADQMQMLDSRGDGQQGGQQYGGGQQQGGHQNRPQNNQAPRPQRQPQQPQPSNDFDDEIPF